MDMKRLIYMYHNDLLKKANAKMRLENREH